MRFYSLLFLSQTVLFIGGQIPTFPDCKSGPLSTYPICDQLLPTQVRAADLISRMNTTEKISQLVRDAAAIPRLNLSAFTWASEALHGVALSGGVHFGGDIPAATSFPMPINLGASFNLPLIHSIASVISTEARAMSNEGRASLAFFTPNINVFRDPRWGRGQETPGEDPFLTSQYAFAYVTGLQDGDDSRYLKVAANCKHFDAYDLEIWNGTDKHRFNAKVSDQDLVETYLPPFEACISDARAASIMCSYNMINGIPACANKFFLQNLARDTYHLDGFVISDCGAVQCIMTVQNYTHTVEDTVAVAMHAGVDLECGVYYGKYAQAALDKKTIVESDIDQALVRGYSVLVRLGYFDPPEEQPYRRLNASFVNTNASQQLALRSAQESIVLLKNLNNALPLNIDQLKNKKIALIGPTANATSLMQGDYYGRAPYLISPLLAFQTLLSSDPSIDVQYAPGCEISGTNESGFPAALELASRADIVFFFGGLNQSIEAESRDRVSIDILPIQMSLLQNIGKVTHSPIHAVFMSGSSLDLSYIRDSNNFSSLIWMGYAGQSGGEAVASVIFGQYNPGGRLPITFYPGSYVDQVSMFDMQLRPSKTNPGRTYKFYTGQAVYEFGSGLSYTTFSYSWSNTSALFTYSIRSLLMKRQSERRVFVESLRVNVTNTGSLSGDDVVLAFIVPPRISVKDPSPPLKQLFGFERVHLEAGETTQIFFPFYLDCLQTIAADGSKWLEPGLHQILIGRERMYQIRLTGRPTRLS